MVWSKVEPYALVVVKINTKNNFQYSYHVFYVTHNSSVTSKAGEDIKGPKISSQHLVVKIGTKCAKYNISTIGRNVDQGKNKSLLEKIGTIGRGVVQVVGGGKTK